MKRPALLVVLLLTACGPSAPATVEVTRQVTAQVTQEVTRIATLEITREVTREVPVTVTPTETPEMSPTPSLTPTQTPIPTSTPTPSNTPRPTPTEDPAHTDKGPGYYLVGSEIAVGLWRSDPNAGSTTCYWEATSRTGDLINNDLGPSGLTMYVRQSYFAVSMESNCGVWTFMGE